MSPWNICKFILIADILFSGRNLTICGTHGHKGYTGVEVGSRHIHLHKGPPGQGNRPNTSRGTHYGPRRFYNELESDTDTSDYFTGRPINRVYYTSLDKQGYHTSHQTSIAHGTLIDIDITSKRSTNKVKYYWDEKRKADVYTALNPYFVARVLKRDRVIWEAQNGRYPVTLTIGVNDRGKPRLTVLYPSDGEPDPPRFIRPTADAPTATGKTHSQFGPTGDYELVILDIDLRYAEEYEYHRDVRDNLDVFTANHPYAFDTIVKGDRVLWKSKGGKYPVKVTVGLNERGKPRITLFYPRDEIYECPTPSPRDTIPRTLQSERTIDQVQAGLRKVHLDILNDQVNTITYYYLKEKFGHTPITSFIAKPGYGFNSLNLLDSSPWIASKILAKAVLVREGSSAQYIALIFGYGKFEIFYNNKKRETFLTISNGKVHETPFLSLTDLKFYTTENGISVELSSDDYGDDILTSMFSYGFLFKDGIKCTQVKYGDNTLKTFDKYYPSGVYLDLITNKFFAMFNDKKEAIDMKDYPHEVKITTEGSTKENDTSKYKVNQVLREGEYEYTFNDDTICTRITHDRKTVWKHRSGYPGPLSFIYSKIENVFTLNFQSGSTFYKMNGYKWEGKPVEGIDLDICSKSSTDNYDYHYVDDYNCGLIPKSGYGFQSVKVKGYGFQSVSGNNGVIWTASNNVFAKAVLIRVGFVRSHAGLILYDGTFLTFDSSPGAEIKPATLEELKELRLPIHLLGKNNEEGTGDTNSTNT